MKDSPPRTSKLKGSPFVEAKTLATKKKYEILINTP